MCSHCHTLAPVWRRIAKELEGVVRIGAVNCEDDWHLCSQINIRSYPTLLHYPRVSETIDHSISVSPAQRWLISYIFFQHSTNGVKYNGDNTHEGITSYVLNRLDVKAVPIGISFWKKIVEGIETIEDPTLLFICGKNRDCYDAEDRLKIAAILVRIFHRFELSSGQKL